MRLATSRAGRLSGRAAALAILGLTSGCIGSGSEVGPQFPPLESSAQSGVVTDPSGAPIADALVTIDSRSTLTDSRGRFRFENGPAKDVVVRVDATRTSTLTSPPGVFDVLSVKGTFLGLQGIFPAPIVLPNFRSGDAAVISVNQGAPLSGTLVDPATGAALVLDGAVASLPGSSATSTVLRFVSLPPQCLSVPLDVLGVPRAAALSFALAPAGLVFTVPPEVRIADSTFGIAAAYAHGKNPAPELDHLNVQGGTWDLAGPMSSSGGFLTSSDITRGGLYCVSVNLTPAQQTIVTATILDRDLKPLPQSVCVTRDGRSSLADADGALAIPGTCAADADGVPIPVPLTTVAPVFRAQHQIRIDSEPGVPGPGLVTDFGERPLATVPSGRVRLMGLYRGVPVTGYTVGVSNTYQGTFDASDFSRTNGTTFFDVPLGNFVASVHGLTPTGQGSRGSRAFNMPFAGAVLDIRVFVDRSKIESQEHLSYVRVQSVRQGSSTVLYKAFSMVGTSPGITMQAVAAGPVVDLAPVAKGPVLTTTAREFDVAGIGTPVQTFRRIAYATVNSDALLRRVPLRAVIDLSPRGYDAGGFLQGTVSGLTDPAAAPPSNGFYATEIRARRSDSFENRLAVALGGQTDPNAFVPVKPEGPTAADPQFGLVTPGGVLAVAAVERDTTAPGSDEGIITKVAVAPSIDVPTGTVASLGLTAQPVTAPVVSFGVMGAVPNTFRASIVVEWPDGTGIDLGDQGGASFDSGAGQLTLSVPFAGAQTAAVVLTGKGTTANSTKYTTSAAAVVASGKPARFLTIPELTVPAPPPGELPALSPTSDGLTWASDPETDETVIRVTRAAQGTNTAGQLVDKEFNWTLTLPGPVAFPFVFPTAPPNLGDQPVPGFFESGGVYKITILARSYLSYNARRAITSPDLLSAGYFQLRSAASTELEFRVP